MDLLSHLQARVGCTRNEALVVLVLSTTFVLGLGLRTLREKLALPSPRFDFAQADSVFLARSRQPVDTTQRSGTGFSSSRTASRPPLRSIPLNTSTAVNLARLPGIGPVFAERIVAYRTAHGPFQTLDDLRRVKGIGPKKLVQVRPYLTLH